MERQKKWTREQLIEASRESTSVRQVLKKLGLVEAGGNYSQIQAYIQIYKIDTSHFKGMAWNKGLKGLGKPFILTKDILVSNSRYQSYKLKQRLFKENIKKPKCEECGWATISDDGRLPLELDHINGNNRDNRLENLRVLCPNCHSLKPTHRKRKKKK